LPININHAKNTVKADENDLVLDAGSTGNVDVSTKQVKNASDPTDPQDLTTKAYVDAQSGSGGNLALGTPVDGTFGDGAFLQFNSQQTITDAIDDLNEVIENIRNNTFVKDVDFTGTPLVGGAGLSVTLNITTIGNPNRYTIDWGDGSTTTATTDSTPTHTYSSNVGSPFDVTVEAFNNNGVGSGSTASKERQAYVTIYTATPVVSFAAYASPTGGSPITTWDDGDTIYFENTTTNTGGATVQYTWNFNDGTTATVTSDTQDGGVSGNRLAHIFAASNEADITKIVTLTLDSHSTATPGTTPTSDSNTYKIYDDHTPEISLNTTTGINEESTGGLTVTFTNNTETTVGNYSTHGSQYVYTWGDGTTSTVNAGTNQSGDHGRTITHKYALTTTEQANGTARDYTGRLTLNTPHGNSPFVTSDFTVHLEPDVRANISGAAVHTSDKSGDNIYDVYKGTDYNGNNKGLFRLTNTSQNGDSFSYTWPLAIPFANFPNTVGQPGYVGTDLELDFNDPSITAGSYNLTFTATGTPDITAQTDTDNSITVQVNNAPSAPVTNQMRLQSLTLNDAYQGTSPRLAVGFTDNSATNPLSAGDSLQTSTARRYTSGTIDTNSVNNVYDGASGTVTAYINGVDSGNKTFTTSLNENGTFNKLIVSDQRDAHDTISSSTYPTGFYQTFDAKITGNLTSTYSVGVNDENLVHTVTGPSNYVSVVYDDMTSTPTVDVSSATLTENNAGTYRYISGIPYYNTGSPTLTLSGATISNLTGQAYRDTSQVFEITNGTNYESTSGSTISTQYKTYANIDGTSSMLTGGIPNVNVGVGSPYAIGNQTISLTSSSVISVETIKFRAYNVNGTGNYSELTGPKIQVHTASPTGFSDTTIPVSSSLGNGNYTDNGLRIADFLSATTDTPSVNGATNYYTNNVWQGNEAVSGTQEATVRFGKLTHDTTDYSSGYLPVGPDRSSDNGTQYFTFAFRRQVVANFDVTINSSTGIAGLWIAAPGTTIDGASGSNGWLDATAQYLGVGVPGANTGSGGNGSDGCALTGADIVPTGSSINGSYTLTLGSENMSNATGNVVLVRVAINGFQTLNSISVGVAS
jgi:hypothetical protein